MALEDRVADLRQRVEQLKTAANALEREMRGSLPLIEEQTRRDMGNTNYNCIMDRCADVRLALENLKE